MPSYSFVRQKTFRPPGPAPRALCLRTHLQSVSYSADPVPVVRARSLSLVMSHEAPGPVHESVTDVDPWRRHVGLSTCAYLRRSPNRLESVNESVRRQSACASRWGRRFRPPAPLLAVPIASCSVHGLALGGSR